MPPQRPQQRPEIAIRQRFAQIDILNPRAKRAAARNDVHDHSS
jgi:hypothetical protein